MNLDDFIGAGVVVSIFLMVFALGTRSPTHQATYLLRERRLLARSLVAMYLVLPLLVIVLVVSFALRPEVKIALVALALSPVPPFLPDQQLKLVTHEKYIYGLFVTASLVAILLVPVATWLVETRLEVDSHMTVGEVFGVMLTTVVLPLSLGMIARRSSPGLAARIGPRFSTAGTLLLLAASAAELVSARQGVLSLVGDGTVLAIVAFTIIGLAVGHVLGGPGAEQRTVLALATASRHPAVAIGIALAAFPDEELAPTAVILAALVSGVASAPYMAWRKRLHLAQGARPARHTQAS
jgi:BASS family bile acid:Na+ symporter